MLFSSIFTWTFLGASLALCAGFLNQYASGQEGVVQTVLGSSLLLSVSISGAMLFLAQRFAVPRLVRRMTAGSYPILGLNQSFQNLASGMGVEADLHEAIVGNAFSLSAHGSNVVALSTEIADSLSAEEAEAVLAHELSHIKNRDSLAKGVARMARLAFPFDPVIRLVEAAVHRERELLADRDSTTFTGKPLALASALLKACSASSSMLSGPGVGLCVGGGRRGLLSLYPDLEERIDVLVDLSKRLVTKSLMTSN
jgi:Zn-dependent protease with chaperone function